jgi:hypothetical protein
MELRGLKMLWIHAKEVETPVDAQGVERSSENVSCIVCRFECDTNAFFKKKKTMTLICFILFLLNGFLL